MNSVWISNRMNEVVVKGVPIMRATYVNLYKWPESDAEFVRSVSSNKRNGSHSQIMYGNPAAADSISCRQVFLRSYKFSRKQSIPEKTRKCFQRVKRYGRKKKTKIQFRKRELPLLWRTLKAMSFIRLLRRFLSSSATEYAVCGK